MANNGNDSQNGASSTPANGSVEPPPPTGPLHDQTGTGVPTPHSPTSSEVGTPSGGGSSSRPQGPPTFPLQPQRVAGAPRVEAGQKTLSPPFSTELSTPGVPLKSEVAPKAPTDMLRDIMYKTCQDTVSAVAASMYPNDPRTAAELAINVMTETLVTQSNSRGSSSPLKSLLVPESSQTPGQFPTGSTFGNESKFTQQLIIDSLSESDRKKAYDKERTMTHKYIEKFLVFPGNRCRSEPNIWDEYWEKVYAFQYQLGCSNNFLSTMIFETRSKYPDLVQSFHHLRYSDGSMQKEGFDGIKALMIEDFQPKGHLIKKRSRLQVEKAFRKHREKPTWWFRRFDGYYETAKAPVSYTHLTLPTKRIV